MNNGKVGDPFEYSHTYTHFLAFLKIGFKIFYRTVQRIIIGLSDHLKVEEIHFTQIRRRRILKIISSTGTRALKYSKINYIAPFGGPPIGQNMSNCE
jgi:hypothetical protein